MPWLLAFFILLQPGAVFAAPEIVSVSPSSVRPGAVVTLTGGPFMPDDLVVIGEQTFAGRILSPSRLNFIAPDLPEGEYLLAVEQHGVRSLRPFLLRIILPPPQIEVIEPATLDLCDTGDRRVTVSGKGFQAGLQLLFDGVVLAVERLDAGSIRFTLPTVKSGLHQVQLVNPDQQRSLPHALVVRGTPAIDDVQLGKEGVVDYELLVQGRNFVPGSRVLLDGALVEQDTSQQDDCSSLTYIRRPLIREPHELSLQVVNPDGERSNSFQITAP